MTHRPILFLCAVLAAGCSGKKSFIDEVQAPFFKAEAYMVEENHELEMPPGLDKPKDKNLFTLTDRTLTERQVLRKKTRVVRTASGTAHLRRIGSRTWLETNLPLSAVWLRLQGFWKRYGHQIEKQSKERGYLLTRWQEKKVPDGSRHATRRGRFVQQLRSNQKGGTMTSLSYVQEIKVGGGWKKQASSGNVEADMLKLLQDHLGTQSLRLSRKK